MLGEDGLLAISLPEEIIQTASRKDGTTCEVSKNLTGLKCRILSIFKTCEVFKNLTGLSPLLNLTKLPPDN